MSIPDVAGLDRDGQVVAEGHDPWDGHVFKTWARSFQETELQHPLDHPDGPDYWFRAEVDDVDFDIRFRLGVTEEGGLVVTGLLLGDPVGTQPITTSNLHRLPIGAIYEAISRLDDATSALAEKARKFEGEVPSRGGQRTSDEQFLEAAEMYKQCLIERPNDPIKCVAEKLGVSSATASRRVSRARDLGLLSMQPSANEDAKWMKNLLTSIGDIELALHGIDDRLKGFVDEGDVEQLEGRRDELKQRLIGLQVKLWEVEERLDIPSVDRRGIPF